MKFLLDTNILIPLEPTTRSEISEPTERVAEFLRLAHEHGAQIYRHPLSNVDIAHDRDHDRQVARTVLIGKYASLPSPPKLSTTFQENIGSFPVPQSNDWVDDHMLAALDSDAVNYLVTEDREIHKKAKRINLDKRVATVAEAIAILRGLFNIVPQTPVSITPVLAHELDVGDSIFKSLRTDYGQVNFDEWLKKCREEHRQCWIIRNDHGYAGLLIVNQENNPPQGIQGKVLKLCTFKISDGHRGYHFGELLLRAGLDYAHENGFDALYVTAFERHLDLIGFLEDFGFNPVPSRTANGELQFFKRINPSLAEQKVSPPLDYHIAFGPHHVKEEGNSAYAIPVQPRYHELLFPIAEKQQLLPLNTRPFGNAIRKAYLCRSSIRKLEPGNSLFFYRSEPGAGITTIGVLESSIVSASADSISQFVGKRTVYSLEEIRGMCADGDVLAILFRHAVSLTSPISSTELVQNGILAAPPQSITTILPGKTKWLLNKFQL